jgi:hypothetical protein
MGDQGKEQRSDDHLDAVWSGCVARGA